MRDFGSDAGAPDVGPDRILAILAAVGLCVALVISLLASIPAEARQGYALIPLILIPLLAAGAMVLLCPVATAGVRDHRALLVPLGILTFAVVAIGRAMTLGALAWIGRPITTIEIPYLSFALSVALLLFLVVYVSYAAWQTLMVLHLGELTPAAAIRRIPPLLPRTLGLLCIGVLPPLLAMIPVLALFSGAPQIAAAVVISITIGWNLMTSALLLAGLECEDGFAAAVSAGFRTSRAVAGRVWKPVVAQLLLLGLFTWVSVTFTHFGNHTSTTNWAVNSMWTGGYEATTRWLSALMGALQAMPPPIVDTLLALTMGVAAIVVKVHVRAAMSE